MSSVDHVNIEGGTTDVHLQSRSQSPGNPNGHVCHEKALIERGIDVDTMELELMRGALKYAEDAVRRGEINHPKVHAPHLDLPKPPIGDKEDSLFKWGTWDEHPASAFSPNCESPQRENGLMFDQGRSRPRAPQDKLQPGTVRAPLSDLSPTRTNVGSRGRRGETACANPKKDFLRLSARGLFRKLKILDW